MILPKSGAKVRKKDDICKKNMNKYHFINKTEGENLEI